MKLIQKSSFNKKKLANNVEGKLKLKMQPLLKNYLLKYLIIFHKAVQGNQICLVQYDWLL